MLIIEIKSIVCYFLIKSDGLMNQIYSFSLFPSFFVGKLIHFEILIHFVCRFVGDDDFRYDKRFLLIIQLFTDNTAPNSFHPLSRSPPM